MPVIRTCLWSFQQGCMFLRSFLILWEGEIFVLCYIYRFKKLLYGRCMYNLVIQLPNCFTNSIHTQTIDVILYVSALLSLLSTYIHVHVHSSNLPVNLIYQFSPPWYINWALTGSAMQLMMMKLMWCMHTLQYMVADEAAVEVTLH